MSSYSIVGDQKYRPRFVRIEHMPCTEFEGQSSLECIGGMVALGMLICVVAQKINTLATFQIDDSESMPLRNSSTPVSSRWYNALFSHLILPFCIFCPHKRNLKAALIPA
jgi:hypothetical protein